MKIVIYAIIIITFVVFLFAIISFSKAGRLRENVGADRYEVFKIVGHQMIVMTLAGKTFDLDEIDHVIFSIWRLPRGYQKYMGKMKIVEKSGEKSGFFAFDHSVLEKRTVLASTRAEIQKSIQYLMHELSKYGISSVQK